MGTLASHVSDGRKSVGRASKTRVPTQGGIIGYEKLPLPTEILGFIKVLFTKGRFSDSVISVFCMRRKMQTVVPRSEAMSNKTNLV